MKLPEFSINRPVTTIMLLLIVVVVALTCFFRVGVDMFPEMDFPVVAIITEYPGVASEEIETLITEHIEEQVAVVDKLIKLKAASLEGLSVMMLEFEWGTDLDIAAQDVRNRVELALDFLPHDVDRPLVLKFDMDMMPVVYYGALTMSGRNLTNMKKLMEDTVEKRLESLPGVASVSIVGGYEREIVVAVDRERLFAHNLSLRQVVEMVGSQNVDVPGGHITRGGNELVIRTMGKYQNLKEIADTILTVENGIPVYVRDVAEIRDTHEEIRSRGKTNGVSSVLIMVNKEPGENSIRVVDEVNRELDRIEKSLPPDIKILRSYDTSSLIRASISQLKESIAWGGLFAVGVIFLFLWNFRATLSLAVTIPFSIIAAFIPLYFMGHTINMMTLSGVALAVGMIVDDAIVVIENIYRHMQEDESGKDAALKGTSEVGMAITSSTLTTIVVFLPMALAAGIFGIIVRPLGLTVTFSLLASLLAALTLIPMIASRIFRTARNKAEGKIFSGIRAAYDRSIRWTLHHRLITVVATALVFAVSLYMMKFVGTEFISKLDEEAYTVVVKLPPGTSLDETGKFVDKIEKAVMEQPEFESIVSLTGISEASRIDMVFGVGPAGVNESEIFFNLAPKEKRKKSGAEFLETLRPYIPKLDGAIVYFMDTMDWFAGGGERAIEVKISGNSLKVLGILTNTVEKKMKGIEGICDVDNSLKIGRPEFQIIIDREKASQMGITVRNIASGVESAFLGRKTSSKYREAGDEYNIRIRFQEPYKKTFEDLKDVIISSPLGFQVRLNDIAKIREGNGPARINREAQQRVGTVSANVFGRDLGSVVNELKQILDKSPLPEGYSITYGGSYAHMAEMQVAAVWALMLIVLLIYMLMAAQFESFLHPLIIMFTIPLAFIGVIFSLLISGATLSLTSFIGLLTVIGIVTKNGILLVDCINQQRERGMERDRAIITGGTIRLRPILMTAMTTIFACIPMALSKGEGAELFSPIGITVIGGLTASTFLTLLLMPVLYSLFDDLVSRAPKKM